jgi:hypothetical protein
MKNSHKTSVEIGPKKVKVCTGKERSLIELMPIAPFVILERAN